MKSQFLFVRISLFLLSISLVSNSFGQKKAQVIVHFPSSVNSEQLYVSIDNGKTEQGIKLNIVNNTLSLSTDYYGRYATISFGYKRFKGEDGFSAYSFWVNDKPAYINFESIDSTSNPLLHYTLTNAIALSNEGADNYVNYIAKENDEAGNFYRTYRDSLNIPKYAAELEKKITRINLKGLEYIKTNNTSYYTLWLFKHDYASNRRLSTEDLMNYYQDTFPDSLKQTFEGIMIESLLLGRINTHKGGVAPNFTLTNIKGDTVNLQNLRGKYVLLDFWASWCAPCRKLMPLLKNIHSHYSHDQLEMISLSLDTEKNAFHSAIEQDRPTWIQILADENLKNQYNIGAIPQILLLDDKGMVIYNMEEDNDYTTMKKLENILSQCIKE